MTDIQTTKPLWNLHQLQGNVEHDLFQSIIVEFTDISGIVTDYYIRSEQGKKDYLYGENMHTGYLGPYETKLIYEPTEEPTLTTGFGINSEEVISWSSIPKWTLTRDVSAGYHPKPGDAIVTIWNNRSYEIADIHEEEKIFQLKKMIWGLVLKPYRFSDESDSARNIFRGTRLPTDQSNVNRRTDLDTTTEPLSAFGDNDPLDKESDDIFDYGPDYDTNIYGY
jgi:hypothetical protein